MLVSAKRMSQGLPFVRELVPRGILPKYPFHSYFSKKSFDSFPLHPKLQKSLAANNFVNLTPCQTLVLPKVLEGNNVGILAETGSGKTLTYTVPILNDLFSTKKSSENLSASSGAIILAPTKELCAQIYALIRRLDHGYSIRLTRTGPQTDLIDMPNMRSVDIYTHQNIVSAFNWKNYDIIVSTPVQLNNILKLKDSPELAEIKPRFVVIDEMDLLLGDENIAKSTHGILTKLKGKKGQEGKMDAKPPQFILAGASLPTKLTNKETSKALDTWFGDLEMIETRNFHELPKALKHQMIRVKKEETQQTRLEMLLYVLKQKGGNKSIIFCNGSENVEAVVEYLKAQGLNIYSLYSKMHSEERLQSLNSFRRDEEAILVGTDIASRGVDVLDVKLVVQFDFAKDATSLLHRLGRVARVGQEGLAVSFVREEDDFLAAEVNQIEEESGKLSEIFSRKRSLRKRIRGIEEIKISKL